ncbi:hypothetical protein [Kitasatospora purpeofusca]|uniref:Uncharacterized protein n=1 Tax=Kitasatospora purpeofusca TaxID=67352 RepID=A0ABZ1UD83_9ACTN|nr:hypothetical protein [Kitasatospora purpeofusca]
MRGRQRPASATGGVVRTDAVGPGRHFGRVDRSVLGLGGRDVLVDGLALELPPDGLLDVRGDTLHWCLICRATASAT